jgi:large subunit ribosomal protein L31
MKKEIHPEYQQVIFLDVSCGHKILTRSTLVPEETMEWEDGNTYPVLRMEVSSASHPFYTGKAQLLLDRGGRIEQFNRRYKIEGEAAPAAEEESAEVEENTQA